MTDATTADVDSHNSDPALLFRLTQGDEQAYRTLYRRHAGRVFRQALSVVGSTWDAEEVAAAAFLELWRRRTEVRIVDNSILPWLLTTTNYAGKNSTRTRFRYRKLLQRLPPADPAPDHADAVEERMHVDSQKALVADALSKLSARDASVVTLCLMEELTMADAAIVLGIPEGTVKSRLSRARKKLQVHLAPSADLRGYFSGVAAND